MIAVQTIVQAPLPKVWEFWTRPEHNTGWAFASDDWEALVPENDLRVGGEFKTRMQSKDGTEGFDFAGIYISIKEHELIEFDLDDCRSVRVEFKETLKGVQVTETLQAESENSEEIQWAGWQAFLDNFKKYVEAA